MRDKVLAAIARHRMLMQGDRVTVGLSGGADSVALLCILLELAPQLGIVVSACHVNHCLRGGESRRDEAFCRELCDEKRIALTVTSVDVQKFCKSNKRSIEEGARILRYEALTAAAGEGKIATAHTLSDSAETVLFNLARGCGLDGLCGISPVRGSIIRPLIDVTRCEVERYLGSIGQDYVTDSSNLSDQYARNRIRRHAVPVLKEINPSFEQAVGRMTAALAGDRDCLERMGVRALEAARQSEGEARRPSQRKEVWSAELLAATEPAVRMRALRRLLESEGVSYDARRLLLADALMKKGQGDLPLTNEKTLRCTKGRLYVQTARKIAAVPHIRLRAEDLPVEVSMNDGKTAQIRELSCQEIKFFVNNRPDEFKNAIDCDKIERIFELRRRQDGDRIRLANRRCTKTFKKLLNEAAVEPGRRDSLAVLSDAGGVFWLERFGVSERAALTLCTTRAMMIQTQGE